MTEKDSGLAGRMDDFAFEVVSEPRGETKVFGDAYGAMLDVKADEILRELRGA